MKVKALKSLLKAVRGCVHPRLYSIVFLYG